MEKDRLGVKNISILQFFMQAGIIMYVRMSINFDVV